LAGKGALSEKEIGQFLAICNRTPLGCPRKDSVSMKAQIRVNLFSNIGLDVLKNQINDWLETEKLEPADILKSNMSEDGGGWTVIVWYIVRPVKREFDGTCTCGAGVETPAPEHDEECGFYCPF
jgi:hypothetical protein